MKKKFNFKDFGNLKLIDFTNTKILRPRYQIIIINKGNNNNNDNNE